MTLTNEGGVINVVGNTGQYGKVWLTYNLKLDNPNVATQGSFSEERLPSMRMARETLPVVMFGKGKEIFFIFTLWMM